MGGARDQSGPILSADLAATEARVGRLREYMEKAVLGPGGFCCPEYAACRGSIRESDRFFAGQLSHVGKHYDLSLDRKPFRIVVVGQEYGLWSAKGDGAEWSSVTLDERYRMIHDGVGLQTRYYADAQHRGRNPHMRGTTTALRILFGKDIGADWDGEFVTTKEGARFHIFDGFALVNLLLCSAGPPNSSQGRSSSVMRSNCLSHFRVTLDLLEPTLIILQGRTVSKATVALFGDERRVSNHVAVMVQPWGQVILCRFSHPSARGNFRWGDRLDAPYLTEVVEPNLRRALTLL